MYERLKGKQNEARKPRRRWDDNTKLILNILIAWVWTAFM